MHLLIYSPIQQKTYCEAVGVPVPARVGARSAPQTSPSKSKPQGRGLWREFGQCRQVRMHSASSRRGVRLRITNDRRLMSAKSECKSSNVR